MELLVKRKKDNGNATVGELYIDGDFFCWTLEDEHRDKKVNGETRIPSGTYNVDFNPNLTGLTQKYRNKYDWFKWHIHVQDVPEFSGVYIHVGNTERNTEGCLLLGDMRSYGRTLTISNSVRAYKRFYKILETAIEGETRVTIEIKDEQNAD